MDCGGDYGDLANANELLDILKMAHKDGLTVCQVYLGHKSKTSIKEKYHPSVTNINDIKKFLLKTGIKLFVHANLSLNFCHHPNSHSSTWMRENIIYDIQLATKLKCSGIVVHTGSSVGIEEDKAIRNLIDNLTIIIDGTRLPILIENMSGAGNYIVTKIDDYALFFNTLRNSLHSSKRHYLQACIDTAHAFLAGNPIHTRQGMKIFLNKLGTMIGSQNIGLIHLNDAVGKFDSKRDIHAPIEHGYLFKATETLPIVIAFAKNNSIPILVESAKIVKQCKRILTISKLATTKKGGNRLDYKPTIIKIFNELLAHYKIKNDTFRISGYNKALRLLRSSSVPIYSMNDILNDKFYSQIGKKSKDKIHEIIESGGNLQLLKSLPPNGSTTKSSTKQSNLETIIGVGPVIANTMRAKGIKTVSNLRKSSIPLTKIQQLGLKYYDELQKPIEPVEYKKIINKIKRSLKDLPQIESIVVAGSIKYKKGETEKAVNDIDLIIVIKSDETNMNKFAQYLNKQNFMKTLQTKLGLADTFTLGKYELMGILPPGRHLDVKVIPRPLLPFYKIHFTTGKEYSREIKADAKKKGYKLSQYGLFDRETGKRIPGIVTIKNVLRILGRPGDMYLFK
jgi:apurinic endonuclease APN1